MQSTDISIMINIQQQNNYAFQLHGRISRHPMHPYYYTMDRGQLKNPSIAMWRAGGLAQGMSTTIASLSPNSHPPKYPQKTSKPV
jgi:hypothetical protein